MDDLMPDADATPAIAAETDTTNQKYNEETEVQDDDAPPSESTALSSAPATDSEFKDSETIVVASGKASSRSDADINGHNEVNGSATPDDRESSGVAGADSNSITNLQNVSGHALTVPTPDDFAAPIATANGSGDSTPNTRGRGRGGRPRGSRAAHSVHVHGDSPATNSYGTPTTGRARGRGRGGGRPRGSRAKGSGRSGKRKRDDDEEDDGEETDSSVEVTQVATETRSGRAIQKPTSFVPPPQSPATNKRKRSYNHRNPQAAVCKVCLRGTSPTSNPVVFCDGCNAPYHRWCHKPPIEQAVIDKEDAEWFCHQCAATRMTPVPVAEVTSFVSVTGATEDQRRQYFSALPQGLLVTLLVKATTFRPDLPVFNPAFKDLVSQFQQIRHTGEDNESAESKVPTISAPRPVPSLATASNSQVITSNPRPHNGAGPSPDDAFYTDDVHPENYPRPGQGLMSTLPLDTEDLDYLVDDDDKNGVFTHVYHEGSRPKPTAVGNGGRDGLV